MNQDINLLINEYARQVDFDIDKEFLADDLIVPMDIREDIESTIISSNNKLTYDKEELHRIDLRFKNRVNSALINAAKDDEAINDIIQFLIHYGEGTSTEKWWYHLFDQCKGSD